ncbi:MAG: alpha/beta hydrolase [Capsulimonas sp.]|uniref:alpha/beta hydrolase n=1 Tax=Capsulimonas sp. TaxID=2494211 RepID=UPI003266238C
MKFKKHILSIVGLLIMTNLMTGAQAQTPMRLWTGDAPGALGKTPDDIPTLTPYLPDADKATGAAMLVLPGGGYSGVVMDHEGKAYAQWLNQHGIAAFVLLYRVGSHGYHDPIELGDASRAIRTIRSRAVEWKVDPHRVGVMGSSAGGHLASSLLTHFDSGDAKSKDPIEQQGSRPDLGVLCYAVITLTKPFAHEGSRDNLLGVGADQAAIERMSSELQVTPQTPPCFVWSTMEDTVVPVENSLMFAQALRKNHVPFDLHVYQRGGHGMGLGDDTPPFAHAHPWTADLLYWLGEQGFNKPVAK